MPMLDVDRLSVRYGTKQIVDALSFSVSEGQWLMIAGPNGAGKSTALAAITQGTPYTGRVLFEGQNVRSMKPALRARAIGVLAQNHFVGYGFTVEEVVRLGRFAYAGGVFGRSREDDAGHVEQALTLTGLQDKRRQSVLTLSGGELQRTFLAQVLAQDPKLLLLDEPTNHLDMHATEWLEDYLLHFKGTVLAISHDRWFLDKVAQRIIEIVNGKAEFYNGNYTFYAEEKQRRYEELRRQYEKNQKEIAHLQKAADDLHLWAFMGADKLHKRAFSMEKRIARLQTAERPREDKKLSVRFRQKEFFGDEVLVLEDVAKSYGEKKLFSGIDELIEPGERIALIGDNGTGKSTLLRCITGEETPDRGWIHLGPAVKSAYLPQLVRFDDPSRNMVDTMLWEAKCDPQTARNRLAAFGFRGEDVFKTVSVLSGGEQSRLRLCILMRDDINFLMLDEPTNHLDLIYQKQIFALIGQWLQTPGRAVVSVVHDLSLARAFGTDALLMDSGRKIALGRANDVLTPANLDRVYGMDVAAWMRGLYRQWAE